MLIEKFLRLLDEREKAQRDEVMAGGHAGDPYRLGLGIGLYQGYGKARELLKDSMAEDAAERGDRE